MRGRICWRPPRRAAATGDGDPAAGAVPQAQPAGAQHQHRPRPPLAAAAAGAFHHAHPEVDLWLFTSDEEPDMAEQTIDLALRWELAPQAECRHQLLLADRLLPVAAPPCWRYLRQSAPPCTGSEAGLAPLDPQGRRGSAPADSGLNSDPGLLLDAACQGLGIALVSERLSHPARQQGQLLPLSPQGQGAAVASAGASGERDHARVPRLLPLA